jgi:Domain of unknown function (DUF4440)
MQRQLWIKPVYWVAVCGTLLLSVFPMWCQTHGGQSYSEKAKQELLAMENRWLKAENDTKSLDSILAPDFLHVVPVGIISKNEQIDFMRKHPVHSQSPERHFENMHVRVYGEIGIVNGVVVANEAGGTRKTLFTDIFVHRDGRWQAVNAQELPMAETAH